MRMLGEEFRLQPSAGLPITRRAALERLGAGSLLALGLWPGVLRAGDADNSGGFRFVVLNDLHYLSADCGRWLEKVTRQIQGHAGVEFCLIAGDLTEYGRREDFAAVRDIFDTLGVPVYAVPGNHDYLAEKPPVLPPALRLPVRAPKALSPKDERARTRPPLPAGKYNRGAYEEFFPRRLNYYFKHRGWQFAGLDSTQGLLYQQTSIQPATFQWVDESLPRFSKKQPLVIFTHFPLGPGVQYRPANADDLLARFKPYNLQAVFCGHWHGFTKHQVGATVLTTNRCCALKRNNHDNTKEKGYFLCTAAQGKIARDFIEVKE